MAGGDAENGRVMISGTIYGVVLNDMRQRAALAASFDAPPYARPPVAPVLYIKPRTCLSIGGGAVPIPAEIAEVEVAATIALLIERDVAQGGFGPDSIAAACLAIDVCEPHASFFRPAVRERCRDGFLPVGGLAPVPSDLGQVEIVTAINGVEAHRWSLDRLHRDAATLVADIAAFMTLAAGDLLLLGLPGDAPQARAGDRVEVTSGGLPPIAVRLVAEDAR